MKSRSNSNTVFSSTVLAIAFASSVHAADGTWLGTSGNWGTAGTWNGGNIADGADFTAFFTGINIAANQTITLDADRTIGNITFTDATTSSNDLTISGGNILTLDVTTGAPVIDVTQSGRTLTVSSQINGNDGLRKNGLGNLALSGANAYTGATSIYGGTLNLGGATANGSLASTVLNFWGGTLSYTRTGSTTQSFTTTNVKGGGNTASTVAGNTLDLGDLTRDAGGTLNVGNTGSVVTSESNNLAGIIGGWATFNNQNWAVANGLSAISGGAVYYTTTTGGTTGANYTNDKNMDVSASVTMDAVINPNTIRFNAAAASTVTLFAGDNIVESGGILVNSAVGANVSTIAGGNLAGSSGGDLIVHQNNGSAALSITSVVKDNTTATGLTKTGAGQLVLTGAHTYTGNTSINSGTLIVGITANTPATAASLGSGNYAGNIFIASGATLSFRTNTAQTLTGIISGGGNFSTAGNAVTTLTGANTYTGTTTVAPQAASVGGNVLSVSSLNSVFTNPTLGTVRSDSSNLGAPTTTANGTITIGAGVQNSSTFRYTGTGETTDRILNFSFNSGSGHSLDASNPSGLLKFVSNITGSRSGGTPVLTLTGTGNGEIAGNIPEIYTGQPVTKTGTGKWTLSGTNAYTGATTVSNGVLLATKAAALPGYSTAAKVVFNAAIATVGVQVGGSGWTTAEVDTLLTNATKTNGALGIDTTNGDLTQWTAFTTTNLGATLGLTKLGTNKLTLDQANTYNGATSVNEGTLQVDAGASLGAATTALNMGAGSATTVGTVGNLTLNENFTTSGAFGVKSNTATTTGADVGVLTIASGKTLTTGAMTVGLASGTLTGQDTRTALSTAGGGSLIVNGQLNMSQAGNQTTVQVGAYSVLDLSGLANFTNSNAAGNTVIGGSTGSLSNSYAKLTLANASNLINALSLRIGNSGTSNSSLDDSVVNLGAGTNTIQASTIAIGTGKAKGTLQFAGSNGSVNISGTNGSGTAAITIGSASAGTYIAGGKTSNLLLAGHTATVNAAAVIAGQNAGNTGGAPTSSITFDTGTFDAASVTLASNTSGSSATAPTATFTIGGPTANSSATGVLTVTGDFLVANNVNSNASATGTATGSLIINGGTVNVGSGATNGIYDATTSTTGSSATTLTLAGGTLNLNGGAIGGTANAGKKNITNLNFQSGTLKNVSQINDGAGFTKTTSGTLTLEGTHNYTGDTNVNQGTLAMVGTGVTSPIIVNGATLGLTTAALSTSTASVTFNSGHQVAVSGTVDNSSDYKLMTAASFSTTPTLSSGSPNNYVAELRNGNTELWIKFSAGAGYSAWQAANGTAGTRDQDHDNDGVDNGIEHFLGGNTNTTGFTALPTVVNNAGTLSVTWTKAASYTGAYNTDFVVETSTTLAGPWMPETVGGNVTITGNDVKYTFPGGPGYTGKNFARLRVTGP